MTGKSDRQTFLFTLRIWVEPQENGRVEWRGKLQLLPEGEAFYFRGWQGLVARLEGILGLGGSVEHTPPMTGSDDKP